MEGFILRTGIPIRRPQRVLLLLSYCTPVLLTAVVKFGVVRGGAGAKERQRQGGGIYRRSGLARSWCAFTPVPRLCCRPSSLSNFNSSGSYLLCWCAFRSSKFGMCTSTRRAELTFARVHKHTHQANSQPLSAFWFKGLVLPIKSVYGDWRGVQRRGYGL